MNPLFQGESVRPSQKQMCSDTENDRQLMIDCIIRLDRRLRVVGPQTAGVANKADPFPTSTEAGWFRWIIPQSTQVDAVHGTVSLSLTGKGKTNEQGDHATQTWSVWIQCESATELFDRLPVQVELVYVSWQKYAKYKQNHFGCLCCFFCSSRLYLA